MKLGVYCIRDRLSGFLQPTFEVNDQVAYRNFEHAVLQGGSLLSSHSADYDLCHIGSFDQETGIFESRTPSVLVNGHSIFLKSISKEESSNEV